MKAVLVIDVPDDFETKTAIAIVDVKNEKGEGVTAMCPLKPMPSYKAVDLNDTRDVVMFCHGWNTCLNEITGETK